MANLSLMAFNCLLGIPFLGTYYYFGYGRNPCYSILVICYDSQRKAMV